MVNRFDAQFERANILLQQQYFTDARSIYEGILEVEPDNPRALHALGVVLFRSCKDSRSAVRLIRQALTLKNDYSDAYNSLAKILQESRHFRMAIVCYKKSITLNPGNYLVLINLGGAYFILNKTEEALSTFEDAISLAPDCFEALIGIARALIDLKRYQEALEYFAKAQKLEPEDATVYYGAALAHHQLDQLSIAQAKLLHAIELKPDYAEAYRGLAEVLLRLGDAEGAVKTVRKAISLKPEFKDAHAFLLFALHYPSTTTQKELYDETVSFCDRFCGSIPRIANHINDRTPGRKLRIGYISGEFNRHPVGFFIEQVLSFHDPESITTYCYSNGPNTDWLTERLKSYAGFWRNISGMCDETVTQLIQQDAIDILVDLSGLIGFGRINVMARKPAPVQVSWIGYYNTSGLDTIDYILMDTSTVQKDMVQWFTEQVVYLPESRFCYTFPPDIFEVKPLPALSRGFITFGCFNNISKITPLTIEIWSTILTRIPKAILVLKWGSYLDPSVVERFRSMFEHHGIGRSRVEFRGSSSYDVLLAEYGDIDIALDPYPFSGATTTCEALWMGVPVITMPSVIPAGRQSMGLLKVIGLTEFIADSKDSYIDLAVKHAIDLEALSELRGRLREMMIVSPLCDGQRFTAELEIAFREMWRRFCIGISSDGDRSPIEIPPVTTDGTNKEGVKYLSAMPEAAYNRGVSYLSTNNWKEAKRLFVQAIALKPDFPEALNNLGIVSYHLGELEEAKTWLDKAINMLPDFVEAHNNLGRILTALRKDKEALQSFSEVLRLAPRHHQAWNNLGELYFNSGRLAKARACFRKALLYKPDFLDAHNNLAVLYLQYNTEKGINIYKSLEKRFSTHADVHSNMVFAMHYSDRFSREEIFHKTCLLGDKFYNNTQSATAGHYPPREPDGKILRVGFVSADLHQHPGGVFFQAVARHHDRLQFSFICYDNSGKHDSITDDLKRHVEGWRCVAGTTDNELIDLITLDQIDILIDLSGHSSGHRLPVFARKPVRIQVSWLGWFNTTGLKAIDYLIVDPLMVPEGEGRFFVEKMAYLPHERFCYTPPHLCPDVDALPAKENGFITFGCFNNLAKITDTVVAVWAEILKQIPQSRLVLKSPHFRDYETRRRMQRRFETHGVSSARLELRLHSPHFFMMLEYGEIDIALDPFPYCGGLTSCEALWMGVPIVTLPGELPLSRQTESFLQSVGLSGCVARSKAEYIECACDWASDLARLSDVRSGLREQMIGSTLCDGEQFALDFGELLQTIWQEQLEKR